MTKQETTTEEIVREIAEDSIIEYSESLGMFIAACRSMLEGGLYRIALPSTKEGGGEETREPILIQEHRKEVRELAMSALRQFHTYLIGPEIVKELG